MAGRIILDMSGGVLASAGPAQQDAAAEISALPPAVARCRQIATFPPQGYHIDGLGFELRSMASAFCCVTTFGIVRMKTVC